jgi:hypothetical protein
VFFRLHVPCIRCTITLRAMRLKHGEYRRNAIWWRLSLVIDKLDNSIFFCA